MIIRATWTGGNIDLAPGGRSGPSNLVIEWDAQLEEAGSVKGEYVSILDRKNKATRISFNVQREHDSVMDAELFILQHVKNVPSKANIELRAGDTSSAASVFFRDAGIKTGKCSHIGLRTFHSYNIVAGKPLNSLQT